MGSKAGKPKTPKGREGEGEGESDGGGRAWEDAGEQRGAVGVFRKERGSEGIRKCPPRRCSSPSSRVHKISDI